MSNILKKCNTSYNTISPHHQTYPNTQLINEIIQWDIRSWSGALHYWDAHINWDTVHTCLALGERKGGLALWLALKQKQVVCSDLCNIKENAEPLHIKYNINNLITYQDIDATKIPYENHFDIIVFKSIVGGIGRNNNIAIQQKIFDEIYKALKPDGKLLFAENLIASPLHQFCRKKFVRWGKSWRYISLHEVETFLSSFRSYAFKTAGIASAFGRKEWQRNILALIDQLLLNHICLNNWKYIVYGIAVK
jgi:SAM-dependent methyltransferase